MRSAKILLLLFVIMIGNQVVEGQILNRVLRETTRKAQRQVENMVVDKVSDAIARELTKSLESAFDDMIREAMESDSNYVNKSDVPDSVYYSAGQKYGAFLAGMNNAADLPEQYNFDLTLLAETRDHNGSTHKMKMHLAKGQPIIGMEQLDDNKGTLVVMDIEKDIIAMYQDKDGKKTVQALPSMMGFAAANMKKEDAKHFDFKATGKTKVIAGYNSNEYKTETDTERSIVYISDELPVDWQDSFGAMIQRISPTAYMNGVEDIKGMVLESSTMEKKKPYKDSKFETTEVILTPFTINNADYEKANYGG